MIFLIPSCWLINNRKQMKSSNCLVIKKKTKKRININTDYPYNFNKKYQYCNSKKELTKLKIEMQAADKRR